MSEKLEIRKANEDDLPLIFNFISDLVKFQNLQDKFTATEESVERCLFGEKPYAEVILGYFNNKPVAYALYFFCFSTFTGKPGLYLEDIFVDSEYRGHGFGHQLLGYLSEIAIENDCGHLELRVINLNRGAIQFYDDLGGTPSYEWITYSFDQAVLKRLEKENNSFS